MIPFRKARLLSAVTALVLTFSSAALPYDTLMRVNAADKTSEGSETDEGEDKDKEKEPVIGAVDEYMTWLQMDERWGSTPMGTTTVARSGCLITSMSIMAVHSGSLDAAALKNLDIESIDYFHPGILAEAYTKLKAFSPGGGIMSWLTIGQIIPKMSFVKDDKLKSTTQHDIAQEIKALMASGLHIILNVNGHHWVYIEGIHGDDIYMIDPGSNERLVYDYYQLAGQNEYWALKGANTPVIEPAVLVVKDPLTYTEPSEYYYSGSGSLNVYAESPVDVDLSSGAEPVFSLRNGNMVRIDAYYENYGRLIDQYGEVIGWTDSTQLTPWYSFNYYESGSGDINGDGIVNEMDAAALSDAITAGEGLPYGVSYLTADEKRAADMNYDGVIDNDDLVALLTKLFDTPEPVTEYYTEPDTEEDTEYYTDFFTEE